VVGMIRLVDCKPYCLAEVGCMVVLVELNNQVVARSRLIHNRLVVYLVDVGLHVATQAAVDGSPMLLSHPFSM